jgi:hypothetical protein
MVVSCLPTLKSQSHGLSQRANSFLVGCLCPILLDRVLIVDLIDRRKLVGQAPRLEDHEEQTAEERSVEAPEPVVVEKGPGER